MLNIYVDNGAEDIRSIFIVQSGSVKVVFICVLIKKFLCLSKYYETVKNIMKILKILMKR